MREKTKTKTNQNNTTRKKKITTPSPQKKQKTKAKTNKNKNTTLSEHFQNPIRKIVERDKIDTLNTEIHDRSQYDEFRVFSI